MPDILEDIRILDLTHVWFGPFCTQALAMLGAEVIKVEPPWGTIGRLGPGALFKNTSTTFYALNLNKKDISIDLKSPEGREIMTRLVEKSDVVAQNFSPGTIERLGFGYEELKEINPKIIYAALSGFGQTGPYSKYGSYAAIAEAMSGHTFATGRRYDSEGPPIPMAGALGDLGPAMYAAFVIMAAIRHRDRTGIGQMIDVSQFECMVAFHSTMTTAYDLFKETVWEIDEKRIRDPNRIWGIFKVSDGWIQIAGERPKAIDRLREILEVENIGRDTIEEHIKKMTRDEAFRFLADIGMPAAPIYDSHETFIDPHLKDRNFWKTVDHPEAGKYRVPGFPVILSETPGQVISSAPMLGQHTMEVLTSLLGYSEEEVQALEKQGRVVCWKK
jgi:crotonobetainyl-CoA:carnitine CoA-transferase CaiB-like acyl-CoA transferase